MNIIKHTKQIKNIQSIPTVYNYFKKIEKAFNKLKHQGNTSRILILILILWNIFLTCTLLQYQTPVNIPQFTESDNIQIMQLEEIPTDSLKFE